MEKTQNIIKNWREAESRITTQQASPLAAPHVTLIAVTKGHEAAAILPLLTEGQRAFGENRVQEAATKWPALTAQYPQTELHLIGPLQTNKVKEALALFNVIHTIDRPALVDAIVKESGKLHMMRCNTFFIQVNTGEEKQKNGVLPAHLTALLGYCSTAGLSISGLMCVPPADKDPTPHFAFLYKLAQTHRLVCLSMGMSADFETAVRLGATHVRLGTALFGERK
jgi:PLP dependent protein